MVEQEFYIATKINKELIYYGSSNFIISEQDLITLLKILIKEKRHTTLGNRILSIYCDATSHRISETEEKLNKIGLKNANPKKYLFK